MRRRRKVDQEEIMMETDGDFPLIETKMKIKYGEGNRKLGVCILIVIVVLSAFSLAIFANSKLPPALTLQDLMENPELDGNFIEERALADLQNLDQDISSDHQTNLNDIVTPLKLIEILGIIKNERDLLSNEPNESTFAYDFGYNVKKVSGNFSSKISTKLPNAIIYRHLTSLMVIMEPSNPNSRTNTSVLINCHFDSIKNTKLDLASCAVMLEVIRVMSLEKINSDSDENILRNSFVFLFNGAGSMEKGALGLPTLFSDQNQERHLKLGGVKAFINLDWVDGGNGNAFIFRATNRSSWLLDIYGKSVSVSSESPQASIFAEMFFGPLFSSRLQNMVNAPAPVSATDSYLNNDTIFDPWIQALNKIPLQGLHLVLTSGLNPEEILPGSLTQMGNGLLSLLDELQFESLAVANSVDVYFDRDLPRFYYDLFRIVQINHTPELYAIICILLILIAFYFDAGSLIVFFSSCIYNSLLFGCLSLFIWLSGQFVGGWFTFLGAYKPWLFQPLLTLFFYGIPAFTVILFYYCLCQKEEVKDLGNEQFSVFRRWIQTKFALLSLYLLFSYEISSIAPTRVNAFLPIFISLFFTAITCILHLLYRFLHEHQIQIKKEDSTLKLVDELTILIVGEFLPLLHNVYLSILFLNVWVPWTSTTHGKLELFPFFYWDWNEEVGSIIGGIILLLSHGLVTFFIPFIIKMKKTKTGLFLFWLGMVFIVNTVVLWGCGGIGWNNGDGVPYTEATPVKMEIRKFERSAFEWENSAWTFKETDQNFLITSSDQGVVRSLECMELSASPNSDNKLRFKRIRFVETDEDSQSAGYPYWTQAPETTRTLTDFDSESKQKPKSPILKMNAIGDEAIPIENSTEFGRILTLEFEGQFEAKTDILIRVGSNWTLDNWDLDSKFIKLDNSNTKKVYPSSPFTDYLMKVYSGVEVRKEPFHVSLLLLPKSNSNSNSKSREHFYTDLYEDLYGSYKQVDFLVEVQLIAEFPFEHFDHSKNQLGLELEFQKDFESILPSIPKWMSFDVKSTVTAKYKIF